MFLNLESQFNTLLNKYDNEQLVVSSIHNYGDKVVIVLKEPDAPKDVSVTVVDETDPEKLELMGTRKTYEAEMEAIGYKKSVVMGTEVYTSSAPVVEASNRKLDLDTTAPEFETTTENLDPVNLKTDKHGRVIQDGMVVCRYCGKLCTPRGCTRHENKCPGNYTPAE